ncbi:MULTISPECIES: hypothetical protein [Prochlorococcus]|nr:hypothetical protein [Prochlorococcus marinus]
MSAELELSRLKSVEVAAIDAAAEGVVVVAGLSSGIAVDVVAASSLSRSA